MSKDSVEAIPAGHEFASAKKTVGRIYVSSAWDDAPDVRRLYTRLRAHGWIITRPWADVSSEIDAREAADVGACAAREAHEVEKAVQSADVVLAWVRNPDYAYRGLTFELGVALGMTPKRRILLVTSVDKGSPTMENMALWHPQILRVATMEEAVTLLRDPLFTFF